MSLPGRLDLYIYRGDTYSYTLQFRTAAGAAIVLTGRTYLAQIRPTADASASTAITLDVSGLAAGNIVMSLTAAQTAALTKDGVWDLQETNSGVVTTLLAGSAFLIKDVTR